MRRFFAAAALLLFGACSSTSQPKIDGFGPGTEQLLEHAREINQAFAVRDAKAIEALLAPEYTFHFVDRTVNGTLRAVPNAPRGRWIDSVFSKLSNGPMQSSIVDVRVYGDIGIVINYYKWSGAWSGQPFQFEGHITDVWVRRGRKWQLLVSTSTLAPER